MNPRNEKAPRRVSGKRVTTAETLASSMMPVNPPRQPQLAVFAWIGSRFPVWCKRQHHRRTLDRTFGRVIREEAHE